MKSADKNPYAESAGMLQLGMPSLLLDRAEFDRLHAIKPWEEGYPGWGSHTWKHDYSDGRTAVWLFSALQAAKENRSTPE